MRSTPGPVTHKTHKRILKRCKGFRNVRKNVFKHANEALISALRHSYIDRRRKKGDFRSLWIQRINAAVRQIDRTYSYSRLMSGLRRAEIDINRKVLADLAITDAAAFSRLVELAMKPA